MDVYNIKDFKGGWFIGDFNPSVFKNCFFEVAHHTHSAGYKGPLHTHKIATEYNILIKGSMMVCDVELSSGDCFVIEPGEIADPIFHEDCTIICVKVPSIPGDKHLV